MEQEKFNLSWNEFQSSIGKSLSKIHKDKHFADVTLACDDGNQIEAHKVILSSSSSFFQNILLNNPHQHPLLYLKGVKFHNLQSLLQFMYLGQTEVGQGHLEEFMITANDLKVEGLMEKGNNEEKLEEKVGEEILYFDEQLDYRIKDDIKPANDQVLDILSDEMVENKFHTSDVYVDKTSDGLFPCDQCSYQANRKQNVQQHIQTKHQGARYICGSCEKDFSKPSHLSRHKKNVHSNIIQ